MSQKMKFKPVVTRVKLNPEQAVLYCACYARGTTWSRLGRRYRCVCVRSAQAKGRYTAASATTRNAASS